MATKPLCYNPPMLASILIAALAAAPGGQIAYTAGLDPDRRQVRVLDLASGESRAVGPGQRDGAPRWSRHGLWLAFETATPGGQGIYLVRGDGSSGGLLPHASPWNESPAWSADGTRIAYSAGSGPGRGIVVVDLDTRIETRWGGAPTEPDPLRPTGMLLPAWLPDGALQRLVEPLGMDKETSAKLLGNSGETKVPAVLAIGIAGPPGTFTTDIHAVTLHGALPFPDSILPSKGRYEEWNVAPSPRGNGIAFESNDGGDRDIFVLGPRGVYDISNHRAADWNPVWSNGGSWLAFESLRGGRRGIYRVHNETDRVMPVAASGSCENWAPSWSPDDSWIAFVSDRSGEPNLYAVNLEDGQTVALAAQPSLAEFAPAWRPSGAGE